MIKKNGFSLIEIMIALTIGVVVIGTMTQIMFLNKNTSFTQNSVERMQDDAHFTLENLNQDLRGAGFKGCVSGTNNTTNVLHIKNSNLTSNYQTISTPIQGYKGNGTGFSPALDPQLITLLTLTPDPNFDVITIRNSAGYPYVLNADMVNPTSLLSVTDTTGINVNSYAIVSNCSSSTLIEINNITSTSIHPNNPAGINFTFPSGSQVYLWDTINYFVVNNAGTYSLYRQKNNLAAEKIVDNVEKFSLLYGINTDGKYNTNQYLFADTVTNFASVIDIKIGLVLKAKDNNTVSSNSYSYKFNGSTITPGDNKLRNIYYSTINLRNMVP